MATAALPFSSPFLDPNMVSGKPAAGAGSSTLPASFGGAVQPGAVPPPSTNAQIVYTDASGKGYNPNELASAVNDPTFMADPLNARAKDLVQQYGTVIGSPAGGSASQTGTPQPAQASASPFASSAFGSSQVGINDPRSSAFLDMLMQRIDQVPQVDPNDPAIKSGTDAYAAQQERAKRSYLSDAAEKGGGNANLDAVSRSLTERAGANTGAFQSGLIRDERQQRRSQIQNILSLYGSSLSAGQQLALQKELNDMNLAERAYEADQNFAIQTSPFAAGAFA